jgi:hypothetical protein
MRRHAKLDYKDKLLTSWLLFVIHGERDNRVVNQGTYADKPGR